MNEGMPKTDTLKPPMVRCSCCGKGYVELSEKLVEVYNLLRESPGTIMDIHARLNVPIGRTAVSNRIASLEEKKLLRKHKEGKAWIYHVIA